MRKLLNSLITITSALLVVLAATAFVVGLFFLACGGLAGIVFVGCFYLVDILRPWEVL